MTLSSRAAAFVILASAGLALPACKNYADLRDRFATDPPVLVGMKSAPGIAFAADPRGNVLTEVINKAGRAKLPAEFGALTAVAVEAFRGGLGLTRVGTDVDASGAGIRIEVDIQAYYTLDPGAKTVEIVLKSELALFDGRDGRSLRWFPALVRIRESAPYDRPSHAISLDEVLGLLPPGRFADRFLAENRSAMEALARDIRASK